MYLFDPTPLQIGLGVTLTLAVGFLAAWLVTRGGAASRPDEERGEGRSRPQASGEPGELEPRQKAVLWTAAGAVLLFLLWWATLSVSSGARPAI